MPFETLLSHIGTFSYQREEDSRKEKDRIVEWNKGGRVSWSVVPGEELVANFAISEKQNAMGKLRNGGGAVGEKEYL